MRIIGHRGAAAAVPENTVAGVTWAFDHGADGVEVDVRRTADGLLVCSHDPSLARVGGSDAPIVTRPLAGLGDVATVTGVLDAALGRGQVVLEVKNMPGEPDFDAPEERTAALLVELLGRRTGDDVVVSSFDWFAIEAVREHGVPTGFLTPPGITVEACLAYVVDNGHRQCHPHASAVLAEPDAVGAAHEAGVEVVCWTVDDADEARRLREIGVDAVITNDPAALRAALRDDGERVRD